MAIEMRKLNRICFLQKITGNKKNGNKRGGEFANSLDRSIAYSVPSIVIPRAKYHSARSNSVESSAPDFSENQNKLMSYLDGGDKVIILTLASYL